MELAIHGGKGLWLDCGRHLLLLGVLSIMNDTCPLRRESLELLQTLHALPRTGSARSATATILRAEMSASSAAQRSHPPNLGPTAIRTCVHHIRIPLVGPPYEEIHPTLNDLPEHFH